MSRLFYGYVVVAACFVVMLLMWGAYGTFGVFLVPITEEYGWSRTLVSVAYMVSTIMFGTVGIVAGRLVDLFGPRLVVSVCGAASGVGYILLSKISVPWQLYLALGVLVGFGLAGSYVPLSTTVARWFIDKRGTMTGLVVAGAGVGTMVGPLTASTLIGRMGWQRAYLVLGIAVLVMTVGASQLLTPNPAARGLAPYSHSEGSLPSPVAETSTGGLDLRAVVRLRVFWSLALIWFLHGVFGQGLNVHVFAHMISFEIDDATAATIMGAIGAIGIVGSFLLGFVADRIGNSRTLFLGYGSCSAALGILLVASDPASFVAVAALFGLGWYGIATLVPLVSAELFGMKALGLILGVVELAWAVGGGIGPVLLGAVFDRTGGYSLGFVIAVVLAAFSTLLTLTIKRRQELPKAEVVTLGGKPM
jgi:MFS family permease